MRGIARRNPGFAYMVDSTIVEMLQEYARVICSQFPIRRVVLFGSFVKGTQTEGSDIDVAVVFKKAPEDILAAEARLYRLGMEIDPRIEPVVMEEGNDPSGFFDEILKAGQVVYAAAA